MLTTLARAVKDRIITGGVLVYGPGGEVLRDLATSAGFDAVQASRAERGISESLKAGIVTLSATTTPRDVRSALICLGDQPLLRLETIAAVVAASGEGGTRLVRARYRDDPDHPGHPVQVGRAHWHLITETEGDRGLDPIIRAHGLAWREVEVDGSNPDVDTQADLDRLERF